MDNIIIRVGAILVHALLNIIFVSYLTNFDISGSWTRVTAFMLLLFILIVLFVKHLVLFIHFIKTKTK